MCLFPRKFINRKYTKNQKNGGVIPPITDIRTLYVPIDCGNCIECRKKKARDWQVRLMEEIKHNKMKAHFVTLTFSNESIQELINNPEDLVKCRKLKNMEGYRLDNEIATVAVHYFRERWRRRYGKSPKHWLVTELGHRGTENIHMHGIIWAEDISELKTIWKYGYVWDGYEKNGKKENYVNNKTINYIIKYVSKQDTLHKYYKGIVLCSPGIGKDYEKKGNAFRNKFKGEKTDTTYKTEQGYKLMLPAYWRRKIYTDEEREYMWIDKLNKGKSYVMGEKCDNEEDAEKLRDWWRKENARMGYRGYTIQEEDMKAENEMRKILISKRLNTVPPAG